MTANDEISVEVTFALPERQTIIALTVRAGTTVAEAIERSRILEQYPEIDPALPRVGIFGKLTRLDAVLRDRDRVEIYRALTADPKEARRKRGAKAKQAAR
jgi:putative ubiquitin-RnfH superfamily antitoxin RatB of RatAB toxin-antitoxin module